MSFQSFKLELISLTGLEKDALHIYVGVGVYLITLMLAHKIFKGHTVKFWLALMVAICFACLGEYLDLNGNLTNISEVNLYASIHDLINTSMIPFILFLLNRWTTIFYRYNN